MPFDSRDRSSCSYRASYLFSKVQHDILTRVCISYWITLSISLNGTQQIKKNCQTCPTTDLELYQICLQARRRRTTRRNVILTPTFYQWRHLSTGWCIWHTCNLTWIVRVDMEQNAWDYLSPQLWFDVSNRSVSPSGLSVVDVESSTRI